MSIRNQNWYNLQSTRSYPLDESSTAVDDTGAFIRDDILVDCHIRFSSDLGNHLYLQGLTVSAGLVTAVFGVATTLNTAGSTIASVTVTRPGNAYTNYSIVPLVAGVSGWVVFGPGIDTPFVGRYTSPIQALINPRCGRTYRPLPVPSIGKINLATSLQGVVSITGTTPVIAEYKLVQYDGAAMRAIVFRLDDAQLTDTYNPLKQFLPLCANRPESGTCYKQPITSIGGIEPDCNGNIVIEGGSGITINPFHDCGGADMTTTRSLSEACAGLKPKRPAEYEDTCCVSTVIGDTTANSPVITNAQNMDNIVMNLTVVGLAIPADAVVISVDAVAHTITLSQPATGTAVGTVVKFYKEAPDEFCWPVVSPTVDIIVDETAPIYPPRNLPIVENFNSCHPVTQFDIQAGSTTKTETLAPPPHTDAGIPSNPTALTSHFVLETTGYAALNIITLKNGATDWAYSHTLTTEFKIGVSGGARNGGIVLNYTQRVVNNARITTYIAVLVDAQRAKVVLRRYTNAAYTSDTELPFSAQTNTWYRLAVSPNLDGNNISVTFQVSDLSGTNSLSGTATFLNCVTPVGASEPVCQPTDGAFGIIAAQSQTFFNSFTVT